MDQIMKKNIKINSVGFIGLGVMGMSMFKNLTKYKKLSVQGFDIDNAKLSTLKKMNLKQASNIEEIYKTNDYVELNRLADAFNKMSSDIVKQKNQLVIAKKYETWSDMSRKIAHEIKNPLTPIQLSSERLLKLVKTNQNNPEIKAAAEKKIPLLSRADMLSELMKNKKSIAIAGSHGKTTTTSLVGDILSKANLDPTIVNGGIINSLSKISPWTKSMFQFLIWLTLSEIKRLSITVILSFQL